MHINTQPKPPLDGLPRLNQRNIHNHTPSDDAPFPRQSYVLKNVNVDRGDVDDREGDEEAGDDGPEEESVVVDGLENRKRPGPPLVHVEEAAVEVFHLPGGNEEEEANCREGSSASTVDAVAAGAMVIVAALWEVVISVAGGSVIDEHESAEAERSHARSVDELVADQVLGEDAGAKTARRTA